MAKFMVFCVLLGLAQAEHSSIQVEPDCDGPASCVGSAALLQRKGARGEVAQKDTGGVEEAEETASDGLEQQVAEASQEETGRCTDSMCNYCNANAWQRQYDRACNIYWRNCGRGPCRGGGEEDQVGKGCKRKQRKTCRNLVSKQSCQSNIECLIVKKREFDQNCKGMIISCGRPLEKNECACFTSKAACGSYQAPLVCDGCDVYEC